MFSQLGKCVSPGSIFKVNITLKYMCVLFVFLNNMCFALGMLLRKHYLNNEHNRNIRTRRITENYIHNNHFYGG